MLLLAALALGAACGDDSSATGDGTATADGTSTADGTAGDGDGDGDSGGDGDGDGDGGGPACGLGNCDSDEMCMDGMCVAECADAAQLCGASLELCCADGDLCLRDACVTPSGDCEFTEDCDLDEICDPTVGKCVNREDVPVCEFRPPPGEFTPTIACQWRPPAMGDFADSDDVVQTPSVANLTDDNDDGVTDAQDVPEIVFISFDRQADGCCTSKGVVRVVSGQCNADGTMTTLATLGNGNPYIGNSSGVALGNLHPAGDTANASPEIVVTMKGGGTIAYRRTADDGTAWTEMWRNDNLPNSTDHSKEGAQPSLADVNGDGSPEVVIGNVVLNGQDGTKVWDGAETVGPDAGVGNNAFLGPASTIADIDLDGQLEVLAGNTSYNAATGAEEWTYTYVGDNSTCQGDLPCDGYNAVGNFDADPEGEVVIVRRGEVFVLEHDGTEKHRVAIPSDNCGKNESGPPTVADFDGDGRAEIGTASADFYVVIDFDCTGDPLPEQCDAENILWKVENQDCSSRATGSSVFDFDGDGNAEVVYADEKTFFIFDGRDGTILDRDDTHSSNTRMEMPIVVDVDNDGKSEVIVPEPNTSSVSLGGIEVWEDADNNWVRTRRIWNQHAYSVTNITEDGQVPANPEPNWSNPRLNNFRQNVQPDGLFDAPDLLVSPLTAACQPGSTSMAQITVRNNGALGVPAGIQVFAQASDGQAVFASEVLVTTQRLLPGQDETLVFTFEAPAEIEELTVTASVDSDGAGGSQYNECDEDNNGASVTDACEVVGLTSSRASVR